MCSSRKKTSSATRTYLPPQIQSEHLFSGSSFMHCHIVAIRYTNTLSSTTSPSPTSHSLNPPPVILLPSQPKHLFPTLPLYFQLPHSHSTPSNPKGSPSINYASIPSTYGDQGHPDSHPYSLLFGKELSYLPERTCLSPPTWIRASSQ